MSIETGNKTCHFTSAPLGAINKPLPRTHPYILHKYHLCICVPICALRAQFISTLSLRNWSWPGRKLSIFSWIYWIEMRKRSEVARHCSEICCSAFKYAKNIEHTEYWKNEVPSRRGLSMQNSVINMWGILWAYWMETVWNKCRDNYFDLRLIQNCYQRFCYTFVHSKLALLFGYKWRLLMISLSRKYIVFKKKSIWFIESLIFSWPVILYMDFLKTSWKIMGWLKKGSVTSCTNSSLLFAYHSKYLW